MFGLSDKWPRQVARLMADRNHDVSGAPDADFVTEGLWAGTRIATERGWCPVAEIMVGDRVLTFDNGYQTVLATDRRPIARDCALPDHAAPLLVPYGAIGNRAPMVLLPDQHVMVESDAAERLFGDPFAILRAGDLAGFAGIERRVLPVDEDEVVTLQFDAHQVVHAEGKALVLANVDLPSAQGLDRMLSERGSSPYECYAGEAARCLVSAMMAEPRPAPRFI